MFFFAFVSTFLKFVSEVRSALLTFGTMFFAKTGNSDVFSFFFPSLLWLVLLGLIYDFFWFIFYVVKQGKVKAKVRNKIQKASSLLVSNLFFTIQVRLSFRLTRLLTG